MKRLLVASDIFGTSDALISLCDSLGVEYQCIDPYRGNHPSFVNETDAYQFFTSNSSIQNYAALIEAQLLSQRHADKPQFFVGFSVGAAALWHIAASTALPKQSSILGFYGGQIRHATELSPKVDTYLIFPEREAHFDINQVIKKLAGKPKLTVSVVPYQHGFMNRYSNYFNQQGYHSMLTTIQAWINQSSTTEFM